MKRREVLQKLAYAVPAGIAFPTILTACDDNKITPTPVYDGNVIIVGAGASGLYAAQQFLDMNIDVKVLEATDRYGGRVRLQKEFFDFPMEMGADWIRGDSSSWHELIENSGSELVNYPDNPNYEIDGLIKSADDLSNDTDYLSVMNFINDIENYNGPDLTIRNAVISAGINTRVHHIADAITSNSRGSSFEFVSIKGVSDGEKAWNDGDGRYLSTNQALVNILGGAFNRVVTDHLLLETPVVSVDYSAADKIILTDGNGGTHECTILILTVPINVIKNGGINFSPALPINNTAALNRIGMDKGYKVMLGFYVNFWGKDVSSIYTSGTVPEYYAPGMGRSSQNRMLSALIMGQQADLLSGKTDEEIIQLLLGELDALYNDQASHQFDETITYVMNWGDHPYFQGVQSYPMVSGTGAAEDYAKPVNNRLFFAGEATALHGNYGTVQGALDSADRVVKEVLDVIL